VDLKYAKVVEDLGADAVIAVNNRAGGHAGNIAPQKLIQELRANCSLPIIAAGGVANGNDIRQAMNWGAAGVSVGTIFIACHEADISPQYKEAMINYGEKDIVRSTKLSGSALTVINTPYVQKLGTKANLLEWILNHNKALKKYAKMILAWRGMKAVESAAFGATYKSVWCAGPAIEHVHSIRSISDIVNQLTKEYSEAE